MFKLRMKNNTDYLDWIEFASKKQFNKFINSYYSYKGQQGDLYSERWQWFNSVQQKWTDFGEDFFSFCKTREEMWIA